MRKSDIDISYNIVGDRYRSAGSPTSTFRIVGIGYRSVLLGHHTTAHSSETGDFNRRKILRSLTSVVEELAGLLVIHL